MEGNVIVVQLSALLIATTAQNQNGFIKYGGFVVAVATVVTSFVQGG